MRMAPQPTYEARLNQLDFSASQVHKTLLGIAADASFLKGDRLTAWCLDAATAALALQSMNWRFQLDMLASGRAIVMPEVWYLDAMQALFFRPDDEDALSEFGQAGRRMSRFPKEPSNFGADLVLLSTEELRASLLTKPFDPQCLDYSATNRNVQPPPK